MSSLSILLSIFSIFYQFQVGVVYNSLSYIKSVYFTNRNGSWYPPAESCIDYYKLLLALQKKAASNENKLQTRANGYTLAIHSQRVCQETTIAGTWTLPYYLYCKKSDVSETTDSCLAEILIELHGVSKLESMGEVQPDQ